MNSPLGNDFVGFDYTPEDEPPEDPKASILKKFDARISAESAIDALSIDFPRCEICGEEFLIKKELRAHILIHLGQPRVILKRIPNLKPVKKKHNSTYRLDPEKKGALKLTIKKQSSTDSLKLTLKKSSKSEDFTVVNSNLESGIYYKKDVAGSGAHEHKDGEETEKVNQPFENVTVNQQESYGHHEYGGEERNDPLEDQERPSLDTNEGDSGVGSDSVNVPEREDQSLDDLPSSENFENSESVLPEIEDHDESDALEATCRETIENLRKLGEASRNMFSSRPASPLPEVPTATQSENIENPPTMIEQLKENSAISIVSKSSIYPVQSPNEPVPPESDKETGESPGTNSAFNWNQLSDDLTEKDTENPNKNGEQAAENMDNNIESAGSLLQNFLIEHQRRNQNETSVPNRLPPGETEYVSLEKLAETVNACRICNEKFDDIAQLDEHKAKAGHFQCNIPDCINLIFNSQIEVAIHKTQIHGSPISPSMSQLSPHVSAHSPSLSRSSPHVNTSSPHSAAAGSPHTPNSSQMSKTSPLPSPRQASNTPPFPPTNNPKQQMVPPVNFEQLPAPVQQLAQQVQRMPLPQSQMPQSQMPQSQMPQAQMPQQAQLPSSALPPGANTMIPNPNYFGQPPGRPPMYRVPGPQGMHYPQHLAHLYSQYGAAGYPQMPNHPQMHPQMPQQMPRGRYPAVMQNTRAPRMPQLGPAPRQRMKRPIQQTMPPQQQQQQNSPTNKQRRMDVLLPDRNEDADCHVIAQQKRNDGLPVIQNVQGATSQQAGRNDSTIHLTDSITLSVRQPGSAPAQVQNSAGPSGKKPDAKAVANVLAARGITVTPAANKNKGVEQNKQMSQQQRLAPPPQPPNVTALNLNSAISIIPASSQRKQAEPPVQFAVPLNRQKQSSNEVERPPRPPTVDLTQDGPPPLPAVRRGRPPRAMLTCQVCDKNFQNQEMLTQHMATHRATSKLLHKCNLCPAQYPTAQALATHKQAYHKEVDASSQNGGAELALPVVDLKSPLVLSRLSSLGIQSYIPLSQLSAQTGGYFGLPIVTIDGARNPNSCNLAALGATSILSLGPLKHLHPR